MQLFYLCTKDNPKKAKYAQSSVQNLERCSKEIKVGLYANFALLYFSIALIADGYKIKDIQDAKVYACLIEKDFSSLPERYEGHLANAYL